MKRTLVTGAGGFIGAHVAKHLHDLGNFARIVNLKLNGNGMGHYYNEELLLDLRDYGNGFRATESMDLVYNFAADMGGRIHHADRGRCNARQHTTRHQRNLAKADEQKR